MSSVLLPSVAGMFYPEPAGELKRQVDSLLAEAPVPPEAPPKALIAPHAGYIYSGPVAASAYRRLLPAADKIKEVVIFAPSHRVPFRGLATTSADYLRTPLGDIPVDRAAVNQALGLPQVEEFDRAFEGEHALEVQLPFLQRTLNSFRIVPFIVGQANGREVSEVLNLLWGGDETLIVISSDLSHFLDYDSAKEKDQRTTEAIESLQPGAIDFDDACGRIPVSGLLVAAKEHGLHARTVDLRNSGDTAGDKRRVVGYGAYVFN
ncbi:MAG TPA: AmmeMemoRadiSam system protein B [Chromatiaceae bacterium]|nr:AmmeMemoRadiSam system protein B [Chromatiaceae bacterium]